MSAFRPGNLVIASLCCGQIRQSFHLDPHSKAQIFTNKVALFLLPVCGQCTFLVSGKRQHLTFDKCYHCVQRPLDCHLLHLCQLLCFGPAKYHLNNSSETSGKDSLYSCFNFYFIKALTFRPTLHVLTTGGIKHCQPKVTAILN